MSNYLLYETVSGMKVHYCALFVLFIYNILPVNASNTDKNKRLLLNDPDVMATRLTNLESAYKNVLQTITTLQSQAKLQNQTIEELRSHIQKQNQIMAGKQGIGGTYVRWGKRVCPSTADMVYSGYAAGQKYTHPLDNRFGGPANMLCLPDDPELSNVSFPYIDSPLLGTEYDRNIFAPDSHNNDVPCVVCLSSGYSSVMMIPGRNNCYSGWRAEYRGLLASGHTNHAASSYICVDNDPDYIPSGERDEDGHVLYVVNIQCAPLPCPPYHNNHLVNCVVCSK